MKKHASLPIVPAELWAELTLAAPSLGSARSQAKDASLVHATWSQRDVISKDKKEFSVSYFARGDATAGAGYRASVAPQSGSSAPLFYSPSGRRAVRFVSDSKDDGADTSVQVWACDAGLSDGDAALPHGTGLEVVWKVQAKVHGAVFTDEWFGGVAWSPDESMFIYVADRPRGKDADSSVLGSNAQGTTGKEATNADAKPASWIDSLRDKYDVASMDPLGEAYIGKSSPALFLADVTQKQCRPMCVPDGDDPDFEGKDYFGDPQWSSDGKLVAVTRRPAPAQDTLLEDDSIADCPYLLGVRYCYNRYSSIEVFRAPTSLDDASSALSTMVPVTNHSDLADYCCSSPRFAPDSSFIVYLSAPRLHEGRNASLCAPHGTSKVLRAAARERDSIEEPTFAAPQTLIDVVRSAKPAEFPGLHMHALPARPWLQGSSSLVFSTLWESEMRVLQVGALDPNGSTFPVFGPDSINDITPDHGDSSGPMSYTILDVSGDHALVGMSSPVSTPRLAMLSFTGGSSERTLLDISRASPLDRRLEAAVSPYSSTNLVLAPCGSDEEQSTVAAIEYDPEQHQSSTWFQVTLLIPRDAEPGGTRAPLVVAPHGGPHAASINAFALSVAAFLASGLAVMYVNFRGSVGRDQTSLESLVGNAGSQDVAEVLQATQWALRGPHGARLDPTRVFYCGGSHGGFLGAHVTAVPHSPFKRIALRNPVVNIASMVGVTDIPEWAFCEAGVEPVSKTTGLAFCADPPALAAMYAASPVARVSKASKSASAARPGETMLFVGGSDKRVPPEQSIEWHRVLTEAFGPGLVTLRWYKNSGHAIDEVPNGDDMWVHTLEFFLRE